MQGKIFDCDTKFAVIFGCLQVNSVIGKDIVELIPSIRISDSDSTSPQVCMFYEFLIICCCISAYISFGLGDAIINNYCWD